MIALDDTYLDWRVEVVDAYGNKRRFYVGRSMGPVKVFLELYNRRSRGGGQADNLYQTITKLYRRQDRAEHRRSS